MASESEDRGVGGDGGTSIVLRVGPFLAAIGAAWVTYVALRDTWMSAPEMAPYVGTSAETMRLLILVMVPISPTTWMILAMLYVGVRANRDLLPS